VISKVELNSLIKQKIVNPYYAMLLRCKTKIFSTRSILNQPSAIIARRPRLLMLPNVRGWAFDELCQQRADYLRATWDVTIRYTTENPIIDPAQYDLMFNPNWNYMDYDRPFYGRYIRGINSHKWQRDEAPFRMLKSCLHGAVTCFVPNKEQLKAIQSVFPSTFLILEGIDPSTFYWVKDRSSDKLVVGWSGNLQNKMKRLEDVIRPACVQAGAELRVAQCPTRKELNEFYNDVDLILIGSEPLYEGNPLSLFEAGACGRTVIATNVGCVPEIVEDKVNGLIVESTFDTEKTIRAFVERLQWCKEHVSKVRAMGKLLMERVLVERTPDKTCETFRQALEWAYAHRMG
jgi:hypothetical protein